MGYSFFVALVLQTRVKNRSRIIKWLISGYQYQAPQWRILFISAGKSACLPALLWMRTRLMPILHPHRSPVRCDRFLWWISILREARIESSAFWSAGNGEMLVLWKCWCSIQRCGKHRVPQQPRISFISDSSRSRDKMGMHVGESNWRCEWYYGSQVWTELWYWIMNWFKI